MSLLHCVVDLDCILQRKDGRREESPMGLVYCGTQIRIYSGWGAGDVSLTGNFMFSRPLTRSITSIIATKHAHYRTRSFTTPSGHGFRLQWTCGPQRRALNNCCKGDRQGLEEERQHLYGSHPSGRDVIHRRFRHHLRIRLSRLKRPRYRPYRRMA